MYLIKSLILSVFVTFFTCAIAKSDEVIEERPNCNEVEHILNGSETENIRINLKDDCKIHTYQFKCVNKSSIIKIKSAFTAYSDLASSQDVHQIQVVLKEKTTLSDGTKSLIDVNKWIIDPKNKTSTKGQIYYSQTPDLTVCVTAKGNSSDFDLELSYEEVEFVEYRNGSSAREGSISPWVSMERRGYRPNSVYVFQITKPEDLKASNIHLSLHKLQIDEGIGEYLLVGAGKDVFQGPPPLFISSLQSRKEIKINDENAYIVFVAASTRSHYSGFEITWKYNGSRINPKEDVTVDPAICDESESMPICIYNISAALKELNKSDDSFGIFRERLASLGNEYARNNSMNSKIDSSQVRIIRVSAVIDKNDTVYVMVKIQQTENSGAAFSWIQLGHILSEYSSRYHSKVDDGYWIRNCPKETRRKYGMSIYFYALVPVLCCLLCVLIWNWKQTPFSRVFSKKVKKAILRTRVVPEDIPNLYVTDEHGRRHTLNNDEVLDSDGGDEIYNAAENLRRSNSTRSNPRESGSVRSSRRSQRGGEINMAFKEEEEDLENIPEISTSGTNTVNSQTSLLSTNIAVTKL